MTETQPAAAALRDARHNANLTQSELAARFGVSLRSVQNWENGVTPHPRHRRLIADFVRAAREDAA